MILKALFATIRTGFTNVTGCLAAHRWAASSLFCCLAGILPIAAAVKPNVVLIYADDLGYADLGCYGAPRIQTPSLDRLASEGMRFTDFYVAQPVCSASRAALLTGCYANRLRIAGALGPRAKVGIAKSETTLAELLKDQGHATAIFGKWHLGDAPQFLPANHGFDEYYGLPYSNDMWPHHPTTKFPDLPLIEGSNVIAINPDQRKLVTSYTERAVEFIERNRARPFFLYLAHNMPHVPLFVSEARAGKSKQGLYGDVIEEIDWSVGEILEALRRHGLDQNTLVIFTSDNGPWLSYGDHAGSATPLREGKGTTYEGGVRVPCIMRWSGRIPAGRICREPAMTIDILPTIAEITAAPLPSRKIDGKSIWPLLKGTKGAKSPHEALFFYYHQNDLEAMRSGDWKLVFPHNYRSMEGQTPGKDGKPGNYQQKAAKLELYNVRQDPGETTELAAQHPEILERMTKLAEAMREDLGDKLTGKEAKGAREPGRVEEAKAP